MTIDRISGLTRHFVSHGASEQVAHARALTIIDGALTRQASILGFNDTFIVTGALVLMILPLVLLLSKPAGKAATAVGAH